MDAFVGEIRLFGGNFAPKDWALCDGQLLLIHQNTALFSLLGTVYGGDGRTTFALPDLRGRVPVHQGTQGSDNYAMGQVAGAESVTLTQQQIPAHKHLVNSSTESPSAIGNGISLTGGTLYVPASVPRPPAYAPDGATVAMAAQAVALNGGGNPHNNMAPYLGMNFIICLNGIFPQRS